MPPAAAAAAPGHRSVGVLVRVRIVQYVCCFALPCAHGTYNSKRSLTGSGKRELASGLAMWTCKMVMRTTVLQKEDQWEVGKVVCNYV